MICEKGLFSWTMMTMCSIPPLFPWAEAGGDSGWAGAEGDGVWLETEGDGAWLETEGDGAGDEDGWLGAGWGGVQPASNRASAKPPARERAPIGLIG
jgi:hypothetical protein